MGKIEPEYDAIGINNTMYDDDDKDLPKELSNEPAKQNATQAVLSMAKAVVGAGSFALPYGVAEAGLIGGGVGLIVLGLVCYYTIRILIDVKNSPKLDWGNNKYVTYADLAGKVLGPFFEIVVYIAIVITSLGACAAYLVFNGQLLNTLVPSVSIRLWVVILGAPLAILSLIKSLRYLSYTSILGDIALCLGFTTVFIIGAEHGLTPIDELKLIRFATYPQFFGSAAFLFCVHMLMLPIEQSLEKPSQFNNALGVNFVIVTILNFFFSIFGYMFYGKYTNPLIINNLAPGVLVTVTKIALVFDLFFTFLIVLVPAKDVIESPLAKGFLNPTKPTFPNILPYPEVRRAIIRLLLVVIVIGAGCSVTEFNDLTNLVSGISLSLTAFILPPWMYITVTLHEPPITNYKVFLVVCNTIIIAVGCFAAVVTTWTAITQIIADY